MLKKLVFIGTDANWPKRKNSTFLKFELWLFEINVHADQPVGGQRRIFFCCNRKAVAAKIHRSECANYLLASSTLWSRKSTPSSQCMNQMTWFKIWSLINLILKKLVFIGTGAGRPKKQKTHTMSSYIYFNRIDLGDFSCPIFVFEITQANTFSLMRVL